MRPQDSTSRPSLRTSAPCSRGRKLRDMSSLASCAAAPVYPLALFRVHVLGHFRLFTGETPISIPSRLRKPQELLQALMAFGGTEVSAGVLIDALWPDCEGDAAYHALESALYRLRQLLGALDAVRMEGGKVSLNRDQLWVDMWEFEEELQRPRDTETHGME